MKLIAWCKAHWVDIALIVAFWLAFGWVLWLDANHRGSGMPQPEPVMLEEMMP